MSSVANLMLIQDSREEGGKLNCFRSTLLIRFRYCVISPYINLLHNCFLNSIKFDFRFYLMLILQFNYYKYIYIIKKKQGLKVVWKGNSNIVSLTHYNLFFSCESFKLYYAKLFGRRHTSIIQHIRIHAIPYKTNNNIILT